MKGLAVVGVAMAFLAGSCVGNATDPAPEIEFVKLRAPAETVTVEPEPLPPVQTVPEACLTAMRISARMAEAAELMYDFSDEQLDIISQGRLAMIDNGNLSPVEEQQRALQSKTVGTVAELATGLEDLYDAQEACEEATR